MTQPPTHISRVTPTSEIELHYTLSTEDEIVDSTAAQGPLRVRLGQGQLHPALEKSLEGKAEGEEFQLSLDPSIGFGDIDPQLRVKMARKKLPEGLREMPLGARFETLGPDKKMRLFRVIEASEVHVVIDGNHPLAGQTLFVEGKILKIYPTTH